MLTRALAGVVVAGTAPVIMGALHVHGKIEEHRWLAFEAMVSALGVVAVPQVRALPAPATRSVQPGPRAQPAKWGRCQGALQLSGRGNVKCLKANTLQPGGHACATGWWQLIAPSAGHYPG